MDERVGSHDAYTRVAGGLVLGFLSVFALAESCQNDLMSPVYGFLGLYFLLTGLSRKDPFMELTGCSSKK